MCRSSRKTRRTCRANKGPCVSTITLTSFSFRPTTFQRWDVCNKRLHERGTGFVRTNNILFLGHFPFFLLKTNKRVSYAYPVKYILIGRPVASPMEFLCFKNRKAKENFTICKGKNKTKKEKKIEEVVECQVQRRNGLIGGQ